MSLSRRDFLRLTSLIAAGAAAGGACAPLYGELSGAYRAENSTLPNFGSEGFRGLSRMTFGPTAEGLRRVAEIGLGPWVEEQLAYSAIDDRATNRLLRRHEVLGMEANALEGREKAAVLRQLRGATLQRQIYSRRQLYERFVEFWTDHFNVAVDKGECWFLKVVDDREVIRPYALGRFDELLSASAHSPAMLVYLDNQVNQAGAPNENYARELMELHTLGVEGGYDQSDVMELARCLTGWTVKKHFWKGEFTFDVEVHDKEAKSVLGIKVKPAGVKEGELLLRHLAGAPSTADHVAFKLVQRFITDNPQRDAASLVTRVSTAFQQTDGDLRAVARTLLLDGLVPHGKELPVKFKRPVDLVTSTIRALSAKADGGEALQAHLEAMGHLHYGWPTPDGPPDTRAAWAGNLMPRWQFALAFALGEIAGVEWYRAGFEESAGREELARRMLGRPPDEPLRAALKQAQGLVEEGADLIQVAVAGLAASPSFQWR